MVSGAQPVRPLKVTCRQLLLLQQHRVAHPHLGQVVLGLAAEAANIFISHVTQKSI